MKPKHVKKVKTWARQFSGKELIEITQILGRLLARDWLEEQGISPTLRNNTAKVIKGKKRSC